MTTARLVPVTVEMDGDELDAEDAWHLARRFGLRRIAVDSFVRFRYGDGFTNSRALAIQTCLAVLPFLLALTGLAADIDEERPAQVRGAHDRGGLPRQRDRGRARRRGRPGGEQRERRRARAGARTAARPGVDDGRDGAGRARQQPDLRDPAGPAGARRSTDGPPCSPPSSPRRSALGFLLLVAGGAFADAMAAEYGWSDDVVLAFRIARWPVGTVLLVVAIAAVLDHAPRRRQPALSWLALGSGSRCC